MSIWVVECLQRLIVLFCQNPHTLAPEKKIAKKIFFPFFLNRVGVEKKCVKNCSFAYFQGNLACN